MEPRLDFNLFGRVGGPILNWYLYVLFLGAASAWLPAIGDDTTGSCDAAASSIGRSTASAGVFQSARLKEASPEILVRVSLGK